MQLTIKGKQITVSFGTLMQNTLMAKMQELRTGNDWETLKKKAMVCGLAFIGYYGYLEHCSTTGTQAELTRDDFFDYFDSTNPTVLLQGIELTNKWVTASQKGEDISEFKNTMKNISRLISK